mmetsp:Transcript_6825/g.17118  ORF Transcript_6825/g.17118 Transcript_6825/m.17118 type:complete len:1395 (+) Transcript_6825:304-4488(+)|eukprot:CAMPEP_0172385296 /NCGR_PEP_ID=MMETSP1061-20121228/2960_1 /TAXON_ID=37318 /ORGANISM="Pseudo-nitzschia pungens, Strain cf. pungens" /LENGTH=1394 /DNA_ID=CAMNT_0013114245 /DNA_START=266 /DNA_END=4453 /DNA_ORIENTATION=+
MKHFKRLFGRKKKKATLPDTQNLFKTEISDPVESIEDVPFNNESTETSKSNDRKGSDTRANGKRVGRETNKTSPSVQSASETIESASDKPGRLRGTTLFRKNVTQKVKVVGEDEEGSETDDSVTLRTRITAAGTTNRGDDIDGKTQSKGKVKISNTNSPSSYRVDEVVFPVSGKEDRNTTISRLYDSIPLLEQTKLPRGGISIETQAVGRVQYGIPPETIKDSMRLGIPVPEIYIVPVERFCRDMGPALGVNLAEFEFPGYFNFFIRQKSCTLVVDSQEAEDNIRLVFEETLLGPKKFRMGKDSVAYDEQDFDPNYPKDCIPDFNRELYHFRDFGGKELNVDMMLKFTHFIQPEDGFCHKDLGVPPNLDAVNDDEVHQMVQRDYDEASEEFDQPETEAAVGTYLKGSEVPKDEGYIRAMEKSKTKWSYGRARWVGDVATIWPSTATEEEKKKRSVPRVEIFKMPSGTEYIVHDIDENNTVIGRARFSGNMKVKESMGLEGFGAKSLLDLLDDDKFDGPKFGPDSLISPSPPSFYPPSFGVTILGNSHGFDPSGSVSGYVLWINGRGLMIDPPPYASATLELEGIRPRTIVGIIITHTHSDHDAGAFQKVLTGSPVVVITTPTIYKSFIRKYAALSSLNPALLRHCHRYKPAIIGQDLRFQGATFKFFYSLHSIPCIGFRVEWRGRSIIFSGDHLHDPVLITKLQTKGILSKGRAEELINRPLQNVDLLLHEAGVPPLHTAFAELHRLPHRVKKRMYVVHAAKIPDEFDLRKAPTGTEGTLRLDDSLKGANDFDRCGVSTYVNANVNKNRKSIVRFGDDEVHCDIAGDEYMDNSDDSDDRLSPAPLPIRGQQSLDRANSIVISSKKATIPLVSLRPTSNTDSWYMLNLLQAVPFLTSLPYTSTMEVLESTRVEAVNKNDVVVPSSRRNDYLCVIWEGTCVERKKTSELSSIEEEETHVEGDKASTAVWHSGDWTGPIALQPEKLLSGDSENATTHDIVATSNEGVKVITLEFQGLHRILKNGSPLYRKYLDRQKSFSSNFEGPVPDNVTLTTETLFRQSAKKLNILDLIDMNTALRKLSAVQKRHLECIAEGPVAFNPGERLWRQGAAVDKAYLVVAGTAAFVVRRRNSMHPMSLENSGMLDNFEGLMKNSRDNETGSDEELGDRDGKNDSDSDEEIHLETLFGRSVKKNSSRSAIADQEDFDQLSKSLLKRAEYLGKDENVSLDSHDEFSQGSDGNLSNEMSDDFDRRSTLTRRRSSRARFMNKALVRLYDRRTFTGGLVFSRGHFLGDISKMVAGLLASGDASLAGDISAQSDDGGIQSYGFGEKKEKGTKKVQLSNMVIHEKDGEGRIHHTSTLTAEQEGCIVLVFPRESLTKFLDAHPGLLLSLLGTQVIV